jgi:hypothetical protein
MAVSTLGPHRSDNSKKGMTRAFILITRWPDMRDASVCLRDRVCVCDACVCLRDARVCLFDASVCFRRTGLDSVGVLYNKK